MISTASTSLASAIALWWSFDDGTARDAVSGRVDVVVGHHAYVTGVTGGTTCALRSDEFSTFVEVPAAAAPALSAAGFTVEAWIAPRAFPWNFCPLLRQHDESRGWSIDLDYQGRIVFRVATATGWAECATRDALPGLHPGLRFANEGGDATNTANFGDARPDPSVPLLRWTHVAATVDAAGVLRVFLNGEPAAEFTAAGPYVPAPSSPLVLGRTAAPVLPLFLARPRANLPHDCSFDGLLDEVKLHLRPLPAAELRTAFAAVSLSSTPPLEFRRMPTAQDQPGRFGAFSTHLPYDEDWDRTRRFDRARDIFVRFDSTPCTFVAWNGTIYPIFYAESGDVGQQFEAFETWSKDGCHEAMMDRQNRHSSWRIVENTPARVVLHWRHALVSVRGRPSNPDPATGWGDWVDDFYTIYPDAVIARRTVLHSSKPVSNHSYAQDNSVLQPGLMPWDIYEREPLSVANLSGQETIMTMGQGHHGAANPAFAGPAVIQLHRFRTRWKPFMIAPPGEVFGGVVTNEQSWPWFLPCWHHWPTAQLIESDGSITFVENGRPKSSCLTQGWGYGDYKPAAVVLTADSVTRFALHGMTEQTASALAPLARSWRQPPPLTVDTSAFSSIGWSVAERAYVLDRIAPATRATLALTVAASTDHPLVRPGLVIRNWGDTGCAITRDGQPLVAERDFRIGKIVTPTGTDLIVWLDLSAESPTRLVVSPP
jgi:hypothetical protein